MTELRDCEVDKVNRVVHLSYTVIVTFLDDPVNLFLKLLVVPDISRLIIADLEPKKRNLYGNLTSVTYFSIFVVFFEANIEIKVAI